MRLAAVAAAAFLVLLAPSCGREAATPPPDIVLIVIDSLRPDHLGCYGYDRPTSPRIDRLAREGVRFTEAVSSTSWTLPAHAALFTGLPDAAHGVTDNGKRLPDSALTLAEALRAAGYRTAGFFGGPYLHPTYGLGQGFDTWENCMAPWAAGNEADFRALAGLARGNPSHQDVTGPRTRAAVTRWLAGAGPEPMFLFVHLWDVHYDYRPPEAYTALFDPGYDGPVTGRDVVSDPAVGPGMAPRDLRHLRALYDAEIRATDDVVGGILDDLAARGRGRDAVVVLTADHGEEFFEHGAFGHQQTLYDESVRIPLVMHAPARLPGARVVEEQARIVDLYPTLLSLAGAPTAGGVQGRDLGPLLRGGSVPAEPAFCDLAVTGRPRLSAVRTSGRKLIARRDGPEERTEYFDLQRDPGERRPLRFRGIAWLKDRARLARLEREAEVASARLGSAGTRALPEPEDPELVQRLRGLGYLGGEDAGAGSARSNR